MFIIIPIVLILIIAVLAALFLLGSSDIKEERTMLNTISQLVDNGDLKFNNRIQGCVYFDGYEDKSVILHLNYNLIVVMEDIKIVSKYNLPSAHEKLSKKLIQKFNRQMYRDVTIIDGITFSNNLVSRPKPKKTPKKKETKRIYKTDDILEKITKSGLKSLSEEELAHLDRVSKTIL